MSAHLDDLLIARLAAMTEAERLLDPGAAHLRRCSACREEVEEISILLGGVGPIDPSPLSVETECPGLDHALAAFAEPFTPNLPGWQVLPTRLAPTPQRATVDVDEISLLAADGAAEGGLPVLATPGDEIEVRFRYIAASKAYRGYVIPRASLRVIEGVLFVPALGATFPLDERGRAYLPGVQRGDLASVEVRVRLGSVIHRTPEV